MNAIWKILGGLLGSAGIAWLVHQFIYSYNGVRSMAKEPWMVVIIGTISVFFAWISFRVKGSKLRENDQRSVLFCVAACFGIIGYLGMLVFSAIELNDVFTRTGLMKWVFVQCFVAVFGLYLIGLKLLKVWNAQ